MFSASVHREYVTARGPSGHSQYPCERPYQDDAVNGEEHLKPRVDEEGAEQAQAVVPQVFEGQLEDVAPANAAEVNLLCGSVSSSTQHQKLKHLENKQPLN